MSTHPSNLSALTSAKIREYNASDEPGDLVATLTNPGTLVSDSLNTFTAPAGTTLDANTTYFIMLNEGISSTNKVTFATSFSGDQTGETGWSIGDDRLNRSAEGASPWTSSSTSVVMEIRGTSGGTTLSTDATLSGLALVDGNGNDIPLDTMFASDDHEYEATVVNDIDTVTLTATKNDSNAMVVITNDDDTSTPDEAELSLNVGSNTLTLTVTAEDGNTELTYTITVERAAIPTLVSNTNQTSIGDSAHFHAQIFETGANADGYTVSEVDVYLVSGSGRSTSVKIRENNSSDRPGDLVATLTNPGTLTSNRLNTFTAPAATTLAASKTYWITTNEGISSNRANVGRVGGTGETGEPGWSIGDDSLFRAAETSNWSTSGNSLMIEIRGTTGGYTASTDATLSGLALVDGDDNAIPLAFVSDDYEYEVSVVNGIDSVVLSATKNDSNAMVVITDDDDVNTPDEAELSLNVGSNTLTVTVTAEDGNTTLTYTITVTRATQPSASVTVGVTSDDTGAATASPASLTFTTTNWNTTQTVTVSGVNDSDTNGESLTVTASASGGGYAGKTGSVSVSVTDDDTANLVLNLTSLTVDEAGSGTFTVKLATQPSGSVTVTVTSDDTGAATASPASLTFTTGNWNTTKTVTVSGVNDSDTDNESLTVTASASGGGYAGKTGSVSVSVTDDDTANLVLNLTSLTVDEAGSGTFTVKLATQPSASVTVGVTSDDTGAATASPASLTFTTGNWNTTKTVTVSGVNDSDTAPETVTVSLAASGGGYGSKTGSVSVSVTDDDTPNLVLNLTSLTVGEAGSGTFTVKLATQPSASVTVGVTSDDTGAATASPASLTFTTGNWNTTKTVTVSGVDDSDTDNESLTVTASASGGGYGSKTASVSVSVTDDDTANLVVSASSLTVGEAGSGTFTVKLATQPSASVTVSVTSDDTGAATASPASLTFTTGNWNTTKTVTVSGVNDSDTNGESVTVSLDASGGGYGSKTASVSVSVTDDDTANLVLNLTSLTVGEAGSGTFTVKLATQPSASVTVGVTSDDTGAATASPASLTFTTGNWNTTKTVTVSGVDDSDTDNESLTVTASASGGDYAGKTASVSVSVTDDDTANLVVSASSLTVGEAGSGTFTVKLATQPSGSVTVSVTSDDTGAATASPASLTFTTGNWNTTKTVTVSGVNDSDTDNESLTVTASASGGGYAGKTGSVSVSVTDDDITTTTDVTLSGPYIRSILVPYDLELGEKALPEEEITVWAGPPFEEDMYVVAEGDRWSPSGVWGDPVKDMIWVVDPIHFGIHALKLSALKDGRIERHIAADTSEFDYRFNYNCHFMRTRASGAHGNPALTVMWGDDSTIWVVNDESGQLDAYRRNGTLTSGCYTQNVTVWTANAPTTARENFKTPFTRDASRDYSLQTGGPLTVRGIWSDGKKIWVSGPPGNIYTIDIGTGHVVEAPGFDGHYDAYGLWSDGTTMWVATRGRLRAYHLDTGVRHAALDVRLRGNQTPGDMWSDGTTVWITYHSGSIEVYRLPERSGGVSQATEAEPLTASFASAPEGHDGESGFTFRIAFSEEVEITPEDMRDHALVVSGGTVTDAAGVDGRKDLWELTVEPTSTGPVSILVLQGRACTETGALCTADGRSLTSSLALRVAGPPAAPVNSPATGRPAISGTAQVGETLTADTSDIGDADGLTNVTYSYQWLVNDGTSDTDIAGETDSSYTLAASDEGKTIKVRVSFTDDAANEETLTSGATAEVAGEVTAGVRAEPPGAPRNLTGAANADGTVTLSWDAPKDDSVTGYQILRRRPREGEGTLLVHVNDTGSTATEYTDNDVTPDVLHAYRVKAISAVGLSRRSNFVNMTPALPAEPAQNSPATGRPAISGTTQVGETLTADTTGIGDADGLTNVAYSYQWIANDGTSDTDIQDATGSTHTLVSDDEGKTIKVRVTFTDDAGDGESLTSAATAMVTARPNTPATGALIISGTAQVGETLTADTSGIGDADGLGNVTFSYQWLANDGTSDTDIAGETDSSYTLAAAAEGKTIKVRVSFTDDAANEETLTSGATAEVAGEAPTDPPGAPRNLTGTANADGTVTLSWDAPNDDSVTGYQILRRRPREGEGTLLVHVNDTGSTATEYTDNDVTHDVLHTYRVKAINAVGLSRQSNFVGVTPTLPAEPAQNSPATGRPAISGTAQVGETLTADTTGIGDADGLGNVTFSYQWLADDVAIQGETGSGYTLASSDAGKTIKVTVSFTDDAGNPESLTSVATPAVTDTAPTERPPAPENLTAVENAGGSVTLTWDAPDDDSVTGYQILRREPAAGENSVSVYVADTGSAATSFTDTDVAAGTKYVYRVKAINDAGVGPQSGRVLITTND